MGTKTNPGDYDYDCYANALPDEPMFVLLGRDPAAPAAIEAWASLREALVDAGFKPESDQAMIDEARDCAVEMRAWAKHHRRRL